jgi:hypothetical protein
MLIVEGPTQDTLIVFRVRLWGVTLTDERRFHVGRASVAMLVARQTCLMVGREVARLPDLVNHGRADQTVSYRLPERNHSPEDPWPATGPVRVSPTPSKVCQSLLNRLVRSGLQGLWAERGHA